MAAINTRLTKLLNIQTPVLSAPMAFAGAGALATQVSLAGGFGFMPGVADAGTFKADLDAARVELSRANAAHTSSPDRDSLRIGAGFLGWKLDEPDGKVAQLLAIALEARVAAVWLAFGSNLEKWVTFVREWDRKRATGAHTTLVFVLVNSLKEARVAVEVLKADVLVAQGNEAGGHGHGAAPPLLALVSEILHTYPHNCPPVVAAGGISTGAHVAALLTLGACGAAIGTRFLLTPESTYSAAQKRELLAAQAESTIRTYAFDAVRGTTAWPEGVDGRGIATRVSNEYDAGKDVEIVKTQFKEAEGTLDGMIVWSGTGVGVVDKIQNAADVVKELHEEIVNSLRAAHALLGFPNNE